MKEKCDEMAEGAVAEETPHSPAAAAATQSPVAAEGGTATQQADADTSGKAADGPVLPESPASPSATEGGKTKWPDLCDELQAETMLSNCDFNASMVSLTGMTNTGVMFAADATAERCAIEGNCCTALAQSALKDEVLERLGNTKEILWGLVHVLNTGTEWAAGNAARALANIAYRPENLESIKVILDEEQRDQLIFGLAHLVKDKMRPASKQYAVLCVANMLVHADLLGLFGKVPQLKDDLALLQKNADPAISTEATRAVTVMNQARFGTISWRAPKRA